MQDKPVHIVESCLAKDAEETLDRMSPDYELIGMSSHQAGTGFGAHVEVLMAFRLRENAGNGDSRQRRKSFDGALYAKKSA
jgi:hypothetical protein